MIPVDALLFDLDGTLIDSARDLAVSVRHLQKALGRRTSSDAEVASYVGDGIVKLVERAVPGLEKPQLRLAVDRLKWFYRHHCLDSTRAYPGVMEMLRRFRQKKLAVVTNKPARISRHILEGLGISTCFQLVLGGDSLRSKKPDPEPIRQALRVMKITDPRRAVMVGDSSNDVLAGRQAGCYTCGVISNFGNLTGLRRAHPDFVVLNTLELMHLFA